MHRLHDLRHEAVSLLLSREVLPRVVINLLGDARRPTTVDLLSRGVPAVGNGVSRSMEAILCSKTSLC